jgi:hypothetical protein
MPLIGAFLLAPAPAVFEPRVIDGSGPLDIWLKSAGDLNGDGKPDLIAGGWREGGLVWYENPSWNKHIIDSKGRFSTDGEAADADGDGDIDFAAIMAKQIVWFENPSWKMHVVDDIVVHDIEIADFNGDGRPDIAARDQGAFQGHKGDTVFLYLQEKPGQWKRTEISVPDGEGLLAADINGDRKPDILVNGVWLENPSWAPHRFASKWDYPHVFLAAGDFNGDGRLDVAMSPSERAGGTYRISWFAAPRDPGDAARWTEHVLAASVESVHHFIGAGDFDGDGNIDIVTASMHQAKDKAITLYRNLGKGRKWIAQTIAPASSHSMRIVDVDSDGRPDLFGADWQGSRMVQLWLIRTTARR